MGIGRRGDDDGADLRVGEGGRGVAHPRTVALGEPAGGVGVDVDHVAEFGAAVGGEVGGMDDADATGAELGKAKAIAGRSMPSMVLRM